MQYYTNHDAMLALELIIAAVLFITLIVHAVWTMLSLPRLDERAERSAQRQCYGRTIVVQLVAASAGIVPIAQFGLEETFRLADAWQRMSVIGAFAVCVYTLGLGTPCLTLATLLMTRLRSVYVVERVSVNT